MRILNIMPFLIRLFMPQKRSHYFTKPAITMAAYLAFYVVIDSLAHGKVTIHGPFEILVIIAVQLPFMLLAFALVFHLDTTQKRLAALAMTDVLTGLPNRRMFTEDAKEAIRRHVPGYMLIIDADHFKRINDTYGHAVGDICLKAISDRLNKICRHHDINGRIGGEEFGAFLSDRTEGEIIDVGKELTRQFLVDIAESKAPLRFTLSIGAAEANKNDDLVSLMQRADEALYEAKSTGRGRLVIWRKSIRTARAASAA